MTSNSTLVCKLKKDLYGLKQAPGAQYENLHQELLQSGFTSSECDHSLFIYQQQSLAHYALVYVNGILITDTSSSLIHDPISNLDHNFYLKTLGKP